MANRRPDFRIAVLNKKTDEKNGNIGGAWLNDDGSISLRIESFVQLPLASTDILITLFPTKKDHSS